MFSSTSILKLSHRRRLSGSARQLASEATSGAGKQRISLALYRQLLRWCHDTDDDVPLSSFVPPVYMTAPQQIEEHRLASLSEEEKVQWFPAHSIIESNHITCPIRNAVDAKKLFRAVFRLNRDPAAANSDDDADIQKQRITLAFEGIRSLNELSRGLQKLKYNRAKHVLRDNVEFRVGQVVKHKVEDWRGIVIGWQRVVESSSEAKNKEGGSSQPTSLTKKSYELDPVDAIRYTILLDSGDAHLHYSKRRETNNASQAEVFQSDLQLVEDERYDTLRLSISSWSYSGGSNLHNTCISDHRIASF